MRLTKQQSYAIASKINSALSAERTALVDKAKQQYVKSRSKEIRKVVTLIKQIPDDVRGNLMYGGYKNDGEIARNVTSLYASKAPLSDIKSVPSVNNIERDVVLASIDADNLEALYKKFGVTIK